MSAGEPTLGGIRPAHERVLTWAGGLMLLALLGPYAVEAHLTLWPPDLFAERRDLMGWTVALLAAGGLLWLGAGARHSRLTKGVASLVLLAVGAAAIASSRELSQGILGLVPAAVRDTAMLSIVAIGTIAGATRFRAGLEGLARNVWVAAGLAVIAAVFLVLMYAWPTPHGSVMSLWLDAFAAVVGIDGSIQDRRAALTNLILTSLPACLVTAGTWRALRSTGTGLSATGWILALTPSVIATLGLKGAATLGDDTYVLLGLRSAILFGGATMTIALSIHAILTQLVDPLGAECHHPTCLVRDEILYEAIVEAGAQLPDLHGATQSFRPVLRRLVTDRFAALLADVAQEHSHLAPYPIVRDDILRLLWGDVSLPKSREAPPSTPPRASRIAMWLAHGRRLEFASGFAIAAIVSGGFVANTLTRPQAEPWPMQEGRWALTLYRDLLPRVAIAASRESGARHELLDAATDDAVKAAERAPRLARALRSFGRAARNVGERHREIVRAGERINQEARTIGLPFYLDVNVIGYRRGAAGYEWSFYVKTYRIDRVREARVSDATYSALWMERLDRTNVVERQLGWTKRSQPRGMVILDVVKEYWRDDLAPALAGAGRVSPLARVYEDHADRIEDDLARGVDRLPHDFDVPPRVLLDRLLSCIGRGENLYADGVEPVDVLAAHKDRPEAAQRALTSDYCENTRQQIEPLVLEVLATKVEAHELQHVIDGRDLVPPARLRRLMGGFSEESTEFAAAELSAYLAEVVYSNQPRLTLVHFMAVAAQREWSPEAFAGRVAKEMLEDESTTLADLVEGPEDLLRSRAHDVYRELFGHPLPPLDVRTIDLPRARISVD